MEQYGCFKLVNFSKKLDRLTSARPEIKAFVSHYSANFQPILGCVVPNFKLKYEDSANIKADHVNTVVFNLHQIKCRAFILGHPVYIQGVPKKYSTL